MSDGEEDAVKASDLWPVWLEPAAAVELLSHLETRTARLAIFERLQHGLIKSIARRFDAENHVGEFGTLDDKTWACAAQGIAISPFWRTGDITIYVRRPSPAYGHRDIKIALFGVRLDPAGVQEMVPAKAGAAAPLSISPTPRVPPSPRMTNPGGRPRKEWWDDLWVEMARQLYAGDLQPKRQADIEKAMADWVFATTGQEASERTFRTAAQKLWRVINHEGKN